MEISNPEKGEAVFLLANQRTNQPRGIRLFHLGRDGKRGLPPHRSCCDSKELPANGVKGKMFNYLSDFVQFSFVFGMLCLRLAFNESPQKGRSWEDC